MTVSRKDSTRPVSTNGHVRLNKDLERTLKRHPWAVATYTRLLDWRCRSTKTFAFVATTGRSGTNTLADLLSNQPGCVAVHEPYPAMTTSINGSYCTSKSVVHAKIINILRTATGHRLYLESSHQFLKNFADPVIKHFGERVRVIHLTRDPVSVASSFYSIGSIPGVTELGRRYLIDPWRSDNELPIADALETMPELDHQLYRCLWYWYETEARVLRLIREHPTLPVIHLTTQNLNEPHRLAELADFLSVGELRSELVTRAGLRSNEKIPEKTRSVAHSEAVRMNEHLVAFLRDRFGVARVPIFKEA